MSRAYAPSGIEVISDCNAAFDAFSSGEIDRDEFFRRLDAITFCVEEGKSTQPKLFEVSTHV